jgi:DtxR family transcriptional regulator, manganese transport regulator
LGLARAKPYRGIFLTEAGAAKGARERHRLAVDLGIEHYVSAATLSASEAFLRGRGAE